MKTGIKNSLNALHLSDIYSLMLFIIYRLQDEPDYAVLSELCYLLDGPNLTRLLAYFSGKTVRFPTEEEFAELTNALLLYQYVNIEGRSLSDATSLLENVTQKQIDHAVDTYLKIIPIMDNYNIDRAQLQKTGGDYYAKTV